MKITPEDLSQTVHAVLRNWHAGGYKELPWSEMLIVQGRLARQPIPNLEVAVKEVLLEGLDVLEQQAGSDAAEILRLRFLDSLTARATANRLNLTENVVYKQQHAAIENLAAHVARAEHSARSAQAALVLERLEIQEPPSLFGVDDKQAELTTLLTNEGPPWIVAVVGIGGIGKTSLADATVRTLAATPVCTDIAWVSARQDRFTLWDGLRENLKGTPAFTTEGLVETLVEQLGFQDLAQLPLDRKQAGLRTRFKASPYLVVVDNLETAADYSALVPNLQGLANPTKFLLTSRHSLHDYSGVHNLSLDELSASDSLALLRYEASERGLADVANAPEETLRQVYEVAGGNPLALKLLIGQMHTLSLPKVVDDLRQARGQTVGDLYRFIYWRSWNLLSKEARKVLAVMPLIAESGGGLEQIVALSMLADEPLTAALKQLVIFSLVNVGGSVEARRYRIHRLTETFLLNEVLKWQTSS